MFELVSKYTPSVDQKRAIEQLVDGIKKDKRHQVLLGATGTGKTFSWFTYSLFSLKRPEYNRG